MKRFKPGDRVVTNSNAFKASTDPNAAKYRGQAGTVLEGAVLFDYAVEMDDKTYADGLWMLNDGELDPAEGV